MTEPTSTRLPLHPPPVEFARFVKDRIHEGWSVLEILDDYTDEFLSDMPPYKRHRRRDNARRWITLAVENPRAWDPDLDEIAIERAYDGDKEVWLGLSHYERQECLDRLIYAYDNHPFHRAWPNLTMIDGMSSWSRSVGEPQDRVPTMANKRRFRARGKARLSVSA